MAISATALLTSCASSDRRPANIPSGPTITWNGDKYVTIPEGSVQFDWPIDEARLSRGFKVRPGKPHYGIDLANKKGTPVFAAENGTVVYVGHGFHGYGNLVVIEHGSSWATLYAHLSKSMVREGAQVHRGDTIALVGHTGHATGNHLHFEIRHNRLPVNPITYLPASL